MISLSLHFFLFVFLEFDDESDIGLSIVGDLVNVDWGVLVGDEMGFYVRYVLVGEDVGVLVEEGGGFFVREGGGVSVGEGGGVFIGYVDGDLGGELNGGKVDGVLEGEAGRDGSTS